MGVRILGKAVSPLVMPDVSWQSFLGAVSNRKLFKNAFVWLKEEWDMDDELWALGGQACLGSRRTDVGG